MYNQEYCQYVYDYFNKDFFQKELDTKLGKCTIFCNKKGDSRKVFQSLGDDREDCSTNFLSLAIFFVLSF